MGSAEERISDAHGDDSAVESTVPDVDASLESAVRGRRSLARKYVLGLRKRHPVATPAELIHLLERRYGVAISTAGAAVQIGTLAAEIAVNRITVGTTGTAGVKEAAKQTAKTAARVAAKNTAVGAAKVGAGRAARLLPAGDEQLQFEITALFALAIADIHGMQLDQDQARALVYGLSNGRVSQQKIADMAKDVAEKDDADPATEGHKDWSHWADTLADALPAGAAKTLIQTIETGKLDSARTRFTGRQQTVIDYGVGAVTGGVTRYVFGRHVVEASRTAFAAPPHVFPSHLSVTVKNKHRPNDSAAQPGSARAALGGVAKATGDGVSSTVAKVSQGATTGAATLRRGITSGASSAKTTATRSVGKAGKVISSRRSTIDDDEEDWTIEDDQED